MRLSRVRFYFNLIKSSNILNVVNLASRNTDTYIFNFMMSRESRGQLKSGLRWTHRAMIKSLLRQNDIATSFWRNNDVIVTPCVCWGLILVSPFQFRPSIGLHNSHVWIYVHCTAIVIIRQSFGKRPMFYIKRYYYEKPHPPITMTLIGCRTFDLHRIYRGHGARLQ